MTSLEHLGGQVTSAVIFTLIGIAFFALVFKVIVTVTPFSVRKEIEEDQNISLAILIGSTFISIGLIIAAAIRG